MYERYAKFECCIEKCMTLAPPLSLSFFLSLYAAALFRFFWKRSVWCLCVCLFVYVLHLLSLYFFRMLHQIIAYFTHTHTPYSERKNTLTFLAALFSFVLAYTHTHAEIAKDMHSKIIGIHFGVHI